MWIKGTHYIHEWSVKNYMQNCKFQGLGTDSLEEFIILLSDKWNRRYSQIISHSCLYNSTNCDFFFYFFFLQKTRNLRMVKNEYFGAPFRKQCGKYSQQSCYVSLKTATWYRHATNNFLFKTVNTMVKMCSNSSLQLSGIF